MMSAVKRSDLSTHTVLKAVDIFGAAVFDALSSVCPEKVVMAALRRDEDRGFLDYGTWEGRPWLTDEGRATLARDGA